MKKLSFVVPAYNSEDYLEKCVESILKIGKEIEIIIVDDGSKDKTSEIADNYQAEYPGICIAVHQENKGHGGAINTGIKYVTGKYVAVIDSDDWVDKDAGARILLKIDKTKADLIICNYIYTYSDARKDQVIDYKDVFVNEKVIGWNQVNKFKITQYLMIHSCIFNAAFLKKNWIDLPENVFYEDNLFVNALLSRTKTILYLNEDFYYYLIGRADQSMQLENVKKRYPDQIIVVKRTFENKCITGEVERNSKVGKCLKHHIVMMLFFCAMNARINDNVKADKDIENMWKYINKRAPDAAKIFKKNFLVYITTLSGIFGRKICILTYKIYRLTERFQIN